MQSDYNIKHFINIRKGNTQLWDFCSVGVTKKLSNKISQLIRHKYQEIGHCNLSLHLYLRDVNQVETAPDPDLLRNQS